jgi:uncharacterized protein
MKTKCIILPVVFLLFLVHGFALDRVVDNAGILSAGEKSDLINLADSVAAAYNFDLVIVTEKSIGDASPKSYADAVFDNYSYGKGANRDGCIFLMVTGSRDFWFSTSGRGIKILNEYAGQKLDSDTVKYLREGNHNAAFRAFVQDWDQFLSLEAKGRSYNFLDQWNVVLVIIAWVLALIIGCAVVFTWKRGMNSVMPQTQAAAYVVPGSLNFTAKNERFLYSNQTKTRKQSSGTSGAAGSFLGSSGRSHGGRGGKF